MRPPCRASTQDYIDFVAFQLAGQEHARQRQPIPRFFVWSDEARARWRRAAEQAVAAWASAERDGLARARREARR